MDRRHQTLTLLIACALIGWCAAGSAQVSPWKTGTWVTPPDDHRYAIETERDIIVLADSAPTAPRSFSPAIGETVKYQTGDNASAVRVQDERSGEHTLLLVRQRAKYSTDYGATGGGHFIKAVGAGGAWVTLEDGSRWDIDPLVQFSVADWEANDLITVRRSTDDPGFAYEVDNTSRDDGALANYRKGN